MLDIPSKPGAYALELSIHQKHSIQVGKLGKFDFEPGEYIYLGSACGPGGLQARLRHHLQDRNVKHPYWQIDYLKPLAEMRGVYLLERVEGYRPSTSIECLWSQTLSGLPECSIPVKGFGASDCHSGCSAHLISFTRPVNYRPTPLNTPLLQEILARSSGVPRERLLYRRCLP